MHKITLFAALGAHNLGDEYIALAEYDFLRGEYPETKIVVHTYDTNSTLLPKENQKIRYVPYFPDNLKKHPFRNIWRALRTIVDIATSDMIIIGGGGIFYDNESGQSFKRQLSGWKFRINTANFFRKSIVFFGIGIDVSPENAPLLVPLFTGKSTKISVRDPKSLILLKSIGILSAQEIPDPAFMGPILKTAKHRGSRSGFTRSVRPKIGLALRKGYLKDEESSLRKIIEHCHSKGLECVFLNHSFHRENMEVDDSEFVRTLSEEYGIASTKSIEESYALYEELDFIIAMRLHAGVIAAKNSIPFFLLSYSKKTDEFARRLGHEYTFSAKTFDFGLFVNRFDAMLDHAEDESFALEKKCDILEENTRISYKIFFHGLE